MKINKILPVVLVAFITCQNSVFAMASRLYPTARNAQRFYSGLQRPYGQPVVTSALPAFSNRSSNPSQRTFIDPTSIDPDLIEAASFAAKLGGTLLGGAWTGSKMLDALRSRYYLYKAYNAQANPDDYTSDYIKQLAEKIRLNNSPYGRILFAPGSSSTYNKAQDILRQTYVNRAFGRNSAALNASNMKENIEEAIEYANERRLASGEELIIPEEVVTSLQTIGQNKALKDAVTKDIAHSMQNYNNDLYNPMNLYNNRAYETWSNNYYKNRLKILEAMQEKINQASAE